MAIAKLVRPKCIHCGSRYGYRDIQSVAHKWPSDTTEPPFQCPDNHEVVAMTDIWPGVDINSRWYEIWNGKWHGGYQPFCTLRCALDYARKAYEKQRSKP